MQVRFLVSDVLQLRGRAAQEKVSDIGQGARHRDLLADRQHVGSLGLRRAVPRPSR